MRCHICSPVKDKAFTVEITKARFAATGLFRLNPDRVLRSMSKVPAEIAIGRDENVEVRNMASSQEVTPQTPVAPISTKELISLQKIIHCKLHMRV